MPIILAKLTASIVLTTLAALLLRFQVPLEQSSLMKERNSLLALGFSRLCLYILVFHAAGQVPQSDVTMFFDQATAAASGKLVYRDFESAYGPLFAYILSVFVKVWHDSRVLILAMIAFEMLAAWVTNRFFATAFPEPKRAFALLLYAVLPAPLVLVVISGQEDVWIWIFAMGAFYLLSRGKDFLAGVTLALGFAATKIILLLGVGGLIFVAANPLIFLLGCATLLLGYGSLYQYAGPLIFQPFNEIATLTPPSIWFLLNAAGVAISNETAAHLGILSLAFIGSLGMVLAYVYRLEIRAESPAYAALWCFVFSLMMILSPKTLGAYVMFYQLPLIFIAVSRADRIALAANVILGAVVTVEDSYWFRLGLPTLTARPLPPKQMVELAMDLVMATCLIIVTVRSFLWLRTSVKPSGEAA